MSKYQRYAVIGVVVIVAYYLYRWATAKPVTYYGQAGTDLSGDQPTPASGSVLQVESALADQNPGIALGPLGALFPGGVTEQGLTPIVITPDEAGSVL